MSQSVIGALRVNLGLDSAQFVRGSRRVEQPLQRMRKQFQAVAGVAAAMGTAIVAAALSGARQIDEVAKSARRLDASIGGFRALELAASEAGVSLSSLTNDIQTMNREIASIGVSGNGARALAALGLSLTDLEGLDADEKLATIADQVKALGLDAGQTTAILRDLGVRNREMALLVLQGGDAIRSARADIADYGLEISQFDANRIEAANDAIGRLGLVTQYAGQQLAIALVPAMGRLAEAITDSLREGGALRALIDGLTNNLDVLASSVGVAVVWFGSRYVKALVAAKFATLSVAGALGILKRALITTGIGALIVGAGYLIAKFGDLVSAVGGFGAAMGMLKDLAVEVFRRMGEVGRGFLLAQQAVGYGISAAFVKAFSVIATGWDKLINGMATAWNKIAGSELGAGLGLEQMGVSDVGGRMSDTASGLVASGVDAAGRAGAAFSSAVAPLESLQAIRDAVTGAKESTAELNEEASQTAASLNEMGAAGGGAAAAITEVVEAAGEADVSPLVAGIRRISDGMIDAIANGQNLLQSFTKMLSQMALEALKADIGGLIGGLFGGPGVSGGGAGILGLGASLFGGARANGGPVRAGMPYLVNENTARSEIFVPSQSGAILNVPQAQRALGSSMSQSFGGRGNVNVEPRVEVIVLDDPRKIDEYRTSPAGERARLRADRRLSGG